MQQKSIPFLLMRGGSSRGPFFNRGDLPTDLEKLSSQKMEALSKLQKIQQEMLDRVG